MAAEPKPLVGCGVMLARFLRALNTNVITPDQLQWPPGFKYLWHNTGSVTLNMPSLFGSSLNLVTMDYDETLTDEQPYYPDFIEVATSRPHVSSLTVSMTEVSLHVRTFDELLVAANAAVERSQVPRVSPARMAKLSIFQSKGDPRIGR